MIENDNEIWKSIENNPQYEISNKGNVRNKNKKILKPRDNGKGYIYVDLYKKSTSKRYYVHRLVAQAFLPNFKNKDCVNHKDCNKQNNMVSNLEWCTKSENSRHAYKNNLLAIKKYTQTKKVLCVELNKIFNSSLEAAFILKIKPCGIYKCASGVNKTSNGYHWKYII